MSLPTPIVDDTQLDKISVSSSEDRKPFTWRMHQGEQQTRKYQLFPKDKQLPSVSVAKQQQPTTTTTTDGETAGTDKAEKSDKAGGLRLRIKEHNLIRRRKVSVPELGPMTTVQEVAMDSRRCSFPSVLTNWPTNTV